MTIDQTMELAKRHHLSDELDRAAALYLQILHIEPQHGKALFFAGLAAGQQSNHQTAIDLISRAIAVEPSIGAYHLSLAQNFLALQQHDDAIAAYRRAVELQPNLHEAFFGMGVALQAVQKHDEAIAAYQQALILKSDYIEALNNLGNAQQNLGEISQAIDTFRRAIALKPDYIASHNNLAAALLNQRRFDEAIAILQKVLAAQPNFAQAWYNLANALLATSQIDPAITAYRQAIAIDPNYLEAHVNLGNALQAAGNFTAAANAYRRALKLRPDYIDAICNLGSVLRSMNQLDEAAEMFRHALSLNPDFHAAHCNLGNALKDAGQLDGAIAAFRRAVQCKPSDDISHSNLIYTLQYHPDYDAADILREHLQFNAAHAADLKIFSHDNDPSPDRRLRIGYVAPHFREHCQSLFTIPLLSHHDHEKFEIFCYSSVMRSDAITQRIAGYTDVFRNVSARTDAELAKIVHDDRIDILIDLTMHMANGRPLLFARKPAPIQIAWLAYPGTTGISAIDYRFSDPHLDPPGAGENFYSEKTIRLPETFWCYDPLTNEPLVNELPAKKNGCITFGCLNNFCKVTLPTIELWSKTLAAVPDSRLLILCPITKQRDRMLKEFAQRGIDPQRIELIEFQPRRKYLELYHRIDIGLDTIPYNGHTTSLDSLWMGVPVVSRIGHTVVGRAGWSQMSNLNLRELVADSDERFMQIAAGFAGDLPRLSELRQTLRQRLEQSTLMDGARFAENIESVYRQSWRQWCDAR